MPGGHGKKTMGGLLCWLFREQLIAKIATAIDADSDDAHALSEQQRQTQSAEIGASALMIERELAALVFHGQAEGLNVEHEVDADPRALLGVRLVVAPRTQPSGTTAGWGADEIR